MIAELMQAGLPMQTAIVNCIGIDKDKLESILLRLDFGGLMADARGQGRRRRVRAAMSPARAARSSNWRVNSSSIKSVEGAHILRALRKVAGAVGLPASHKVRFSTTARLTDADLDSEDIRIDAGDLFTRAPIPPENLDILVGRTLHEVDHYTINSSWCLVELLLQGCRNRNAICSGLSSTSAKTSSSITGSPPTSTSATTTRLPWRSSSTVDASRVSTTSLRYGSNTPLAHNDLILDMVPANLRPAIDDLIDLTNQLKEPMDRLTGTRRRAELYSSTWNSIKKSCCIRRRCRTKVHATAGASPEDSPPGDQAVQEQPHPARTHRPAQPTDQGTVTMTCR